METNRSECIWQGLIAGLIGYAAVALLVGTMDALQGRSFFFTASLLGEWLFYGLTDPSKVVVWPGAVFAYNGVHLLTFLAFGVLAGWMAAVSERGPLFWYAAIVLFLIAFLHMFGAILLMTEGLRNVLPAYEVWIPAVVSVIAMAGYLLLIHPRLRREMRVWTEAV